MPLVNVHMAAGRTADQKRALLTAITDAVVDTLGAPRDSVRVWVTEMADTDYMAAGELLADKRTRTAGG
jgi:4-oxalocrotonate tautomerase